MGEQSAEQLLKKIRHALRLDRIPPTARKVVVTIVGGLFLVAGLVMVVMPGPAFVFVPLGLLLLASEFCWAERLADKLMHAFHTARAKWKRFRQRRARAT